jgi:hypothetical protein
MSFKHSNLKLAFKNLFLPRRKDLIVLEPHMGLGDNLICLGLVKTIAERHPRKIFYFACLKNYFHSIAWMLRELNNVIPIAVDSGREARQYAEFKNATYLPIGIIDVDINKFDQSFYSQHKVPFAARWDLAKTPAGPYSKDLGKQLNPHDVPYILVCVKDSSGEGYDLMIANPLKCLVIEVGPETNNIFDWTDLVVGAQEIHTVDTGFIHFVESILTPETQAKLYFHRIRQSPTEFTRRLPWEEVHYRSMHQMHKL